MLSFERLSYFRSSVVLGHLCKSVRQMSSTARGIRLIWLAGNLLVRRWRGNSVDVGVDSLLKGGPMTKTGRAGEVLTVCATAVS